MGAESREKLASYAMRVEESAGRRYPEPVHPYRNDYERDRDRIIHSRAFRRLENKTQVFTKRYSDHFRTRLTHTLEVAQISRTVARALALNQDLMEALALVHDVGHPPFGHAGEDCLNQLMAEYQGGFDHNLHALRIVEQFEQKYAAFSGLNLTFEVREGIVKHSRDYNLREHPELAEYLLDERPPLEAQLIDVADEIAYNCADLDDGYESKLLSLAVIRENVPLFDKFYRPIDAMYPGAPEKLKFNEGLRRLVDALVTDLIGAVRGRLRKRRVESVAEVRASRKRLAGFNPGMAEENQKLKRFLQAYLYAHPNLSGERKKITQHIEQLFHYYLRYPKSLPVSHFAKVPREPLTQVVCDYIAGMTDNFFAQQHQRILGNRRDGL